MNRFALAVYCDDIRQELGNKISLMGIYQEVMFLSAMPAVIPKLCVSVWVRTPKENPFKKLTLRLLADDKVLVVHEIPEVVAILEKTTTMEVLEGPVPEDGVTSIQMAHIALQISPLTVEKPMRLRLRIQTEEEEIRAGGLSIALAEPQKAS